MPQFGDYELESEIARGGMGVVYRARQKSLNRTVAIKMILAGQLATPESVQRFRLEAEAAARLHHPGIVPIFEIGEYETQHFFSMELVEGGSLADCMSDLRMQPESSASERQEQERCVAELISRVARALEFAHQRGVLHRDIKPSNILIDENLQPRLTDFGLSKLTGRETSGLTLSSAVLGTPGYLAPEQAAGRADEVTTAADVYGLGATLYELLTGRTPFVGSTAIETMIQAIDRDPTPPSKFNPMVSPDLETIALKCIEREPSRRYHSAAEVADELERFLQGEPILARPVGTWEQAWRWCERNPHLSLVTSALILAVIVGVAGVGWQWLRAEQANITLTESVGHLEWEAIDTLLDKGQSSRALAKVACLLRENPDDWKAAMFAMSILEQRRFPLAVAPQIRHPQGAELAVARLSRDGSRVVTASFDGTARLWNPTTSEEVTPPLQHGGPVTWADFRADNKVVATCCEDKVLRFWNTADGSLIREVYRFDEPILRIAFSRDSNYLLARTQTTVAVFAGSDGKLLVGPIRHAGRVAAAKFILEGKGFFSAESEGSDAQVRVWTLPSGAELASMKTGPVRDADLNDAATRIGLIDQAGTAWTSGFPSGANRRSIFHQGSYFERVLMNYVGNRLATLSNDHTARVWDARSGAPITASLPHYYLLNGAEFLGGGQRLITWADDSLAQVWEIETGRPYCEPMRHSNRVIFTEMGTSAHDETFLTTISHLKSRSAETRTGAAQMWSVHTEPLFRRRILSHDPNSHDGCKVSPDGKIVAIGKTSQEVLILDAQTGEPICESLKVRTSPWGLLFTPDGRRLISTTSGGQVAVWSMPEGKLLGKPVEIGAMIQPAEISDDGKIFATGSTDGFVRIWDTQSGQVVHQVKHGSEINSLAFSPDGLHLASAGEDRVVRIWDTATGKIFHVMRGHQNEVLNVQYRGDGRRLVTASLDFTARVWNMEPGPSFGQQLKVLQHQGEVLDARFSPDGGRVATGSRDRTATIWNVETGHPMVRAMIHEQGVRNVEFSPTGDRLLTQDFRGIRLWDVSTGHPVTVHIPHFLYGGTGFQGSSTRPAFLNGGKSVLLSMDSRQGEIYHFSVPSQRAPDWFAEFLEVVAGERLIDQGSRPQLVPPEEFLAVKRRIQNSADQDFHTEWAQRWLSGGREGKPSNAFPVAER